MSAEKYEEIMRAQAELAKHDSALQWRAVEDKSNVELRDFTVRALIGEGGFGKVYLVQKNDTKAAYAMKSIRKPQILPQVVG